MTSIFLVPTVLFVISLGGLVWALLVEGPQDVPAALATGSAFAVLAWLWLRPRRKPPASGDQ